MKNALCLLVVMLLTSGCNTSGGDSTSSAGQETLSPEERARSPLEVVNLRMQAYNEHDLDAFLSTYSAGIEVLTYADGKSLGKGKNHIRNIFESLFQEGSVRVDIHHQIAKDSYVINHETVVSGGQETEYVSIYEVRDGLIRSVRFVRD